MTRPPESLGQPEFVYVEERAADWRVHVYTCDVDAQCRWECLLAVRTAEEAEDMANLIRRAMRARVSYAVLGSAAWAFAPTPSVPPGVVSGTREERTN